MLRLFANISILLTVSCVLSCSNRNEPRTDHRLSLILRATLNDPKAIAIKMERVHVKTDFDLFPVNQIINRRLGQIEQSGTFTPLLNAERHVYGIGATDSYIIASGQFTDVYIADKDAVTNCYLIAFKKTSKNDPVHCISNVHPNIVMNGSPGFTTSGKSVYYILNKELKVWSEETLSSKTLLSRNDPHEPPLVDIFVHSGSETICGLVPPRPNINGKLICNSSDKTTWNSVPLGRHLVDHKTFRLNEDLVITQGSILSLKDLSYQSRVLPSLLEYLPADPSVRIPTHKGGMVALTVHGELFKMDSEGVTTLLDRSSSWEKLIGFGNYAWVYRSGILKRISLSEGALESTNYFEQMRPFDIQEMFLTTDDLIQLVPSNNSSGNSSGNSSSHSEDAYLNYITGRVEIYPKSQIRPTLQSILPLSY